MTARKEPVSLDGVVDQIDRMILQLLEEGAEPSLLAFALTSVAAGMALQLTHDPLMVFPLLLEAIAERALRSNRGSLAEELESPLSATSCPQIMSQQRPAQLPTKSTQAREHADVLYCLTGEDGKVGS